MAKKQVVQVFGMSPEILPDSYVDRGKLDSEIRTVLGSKVHLAISGESKSGKSWLRQQVIDRPLVVQCRLNRTPLDLFVDALSQLNIRLEISMIKGSEFSGKITPEVGIGEGLLSSVFGVKAGVSAEAAAGSTKEVSSVPVGRNINDLRWVAQIIKESGRRFVIEDFHYMSTENRKLMAYDLKSLWEYGLFVVVVGIWGEGNNLVYFNPDLTGRVVEKNFVWSTADLERIVTNGASALGLIFSAEILRRMSSCVYGNAGMMQVLVSTLLAECRVSEDQSENKVIIEDLDALDSACLRCAENLNARYQQFALRVSDGVRKRNRSTGIYAHAMSAIMEASDEELLKGLSAKKIFEVCHGREKRIQLANLKSVLRRFESLQVDDNGRGLVLAYDEADNGRIIVVDRQLLFYRRFCTVQWP